MAPVLTVPESLKPLILQLRAYVTLQDIGVPLAELKKMEMRDQLKLAVASWSRDGLGTPVAIHLYYIVKAVLYILGFCAFQAKSLRPSSWMLTLGRIRRDALLRQDAFRRFVIYNLFFEVLGMGCGSGPLTGRLIPGHTSWFHFLCPGTIKLPFRLNPRDSRKPLLPMLSTRRNLFDVSLFVGYLVSLLRALTAKAVTPALCRPVCAFLGSLALVDHSAFLASRGDVYGYMTVCLAAGVPVLGAQLCQLAIYFWAGFSKLGPWFKHVIQAMLSNSPVFPSQFRKFLYRDLQAHDFQPTALASGLAQLGAGLEAAIPALLPWGGIWSKLGLFGALNLHGFIFANFAIGCPQEWNIFTPLAVYHLFLDASNGVDGRALRSLPSRHPLLAAFLGFVLGIVPAVGNAIPQTNSFLTSMKYYAGNWPSTVWLVKRSAVHKLQKIRTLSEPFPKQAANLFGEQVGYESVLKVYAFRALHLPYRCLPMLLEKALQGKPFQDYEYADGETMAGVILGYNFGDGYLHGRFMVQAVQDVCNFERGELLHICIDSCPTLGDKVPWFVRDATRLWNDSDAIAIGQTSLQELQAMQPY